MRLEFPEGLARTGFCVSKTDKCLQACYLCEPGPLITSYEQRNFSPTMLQVSSTKTGGT